MRNSITLILSAIIAVNKVSACVPNCWAEKLGYPCCKEVNYLHVDGMVFDDNVEVVSEDFDGKWGVDENGNKCGILEIDPRVNCLPIVPKDNYGECSSEQCYDVKRVDADGTIWGYDKEKNKRCTINPKVCQKLTSQTCWSALLGYSCCTEPSTLYKDESGLWSIENDQWCGVEFCPRCSETEIQSIDKYGNLWSYDEENHRKCIVNKKSVECNLHIKNTCRFNSIGYPCCNETKDIVTEDENGFWGIENGKWCGFQENYPCNFYEKKGIKCCTDQSPVNIIESKEKGTYAMKDGEICGLNSIVIF
jgi:hypothetical protein